VTPIAANWQVSRKSNSQEPARATPFQPGGRHFTLRKGPAENANSSRRLNKRLSRSKPILPWRSTFADVWPQHCPHFTGAPLNDSFQKLRATGVDGLRSLLADEILREAKKRFAKPN
jgi:hypothetical protein